MFRFIALLLLSFIVCSFPVQAASFEQAFKQAQAAYKAGDYAKAGELFVQTAKLLEKAKEPTKAQMVLGNAAIAYMQGKDYESAVQVYESLLGRAGKIEQKVLLKSYKNLVICHSNLEQHALKIQSLERMMRALPQLPKAELSNAYAQMGDAYRALELYARAADAYDKAAHLLPHDGDPRVRGRLLTAMGLCQGNLGNFDAASDSLSKAKELATRINEPLTVAESDSNLGILYWERGDYPQALQLLNNSLEAERKNMLRRNEGVDLNNLGLVKKSMGYFPNAMQAFEDALAIAREVGSRKDEAIALSNRALLNRITGKLSEARADYRAALELYESTGFQEGKAGALLGIGKIAEREDRDLNIALNCYQDALNIYAKLNLPRSQAEALLQIGGVLKQTALPGRTTRDLVFDDEPTVPPIGKDEALTEAEKAYQSALQLAEQVGSKEMLWAAHQGLGFCAFQKGQLEAALEHYTFSINLVTTMRASLESVELLGEYMAGKEDLYSEAMEVCARLHETTQDAKYLELQMQFDETLRNEIQKASASLVRMEFEEPDKQQLYDKLVALGRKQAKAESSVPVVASVPADASEETKLVHKIKTEEAEKQKATVQQLDQDYETLLAEWKEKYPGDAVIFESSARLDIPKIQQSLSDDQVLLHYMQLTDELVIVCITKDRVDSKVVNISQKELNNLICKEFLVKYIEGSRSLGTSEENDKKHFNIAISILSQLYKYLINPIESTIQYKRTLYISSGGFLAQVPFSALISSIQDEIPHFLVEKFDIGNIRPSFISTIYVADKKKPTRTLLAVGNPHNKNIVTLKDLPGAKKEVEDIYKFLNKHSMETDVKYEEEATDIWMIDKFRTNSYEILYFATHGVPYSEIYYAYELYYKQVSKQYGEEKIKAEKAFITDNLPTFSPLNGYLFMSPNEMKKSSGLLTIKKIMEIPDSSFVNTRYVILSACNTGVTFAPKTLKKDITINKFSESKDMEKELRKTGWIPGVDQVSFVDAFMRRKVDNVYGTLWFADDDASAYLMNHFMENIVAQKEQQNAVAAFSETQRQYIKESKNGEKPLGNNCFVPLHPYFWAVGALFGK